MKRLLKKYNDMKYRYKLTNLLVLVSLVPMTVLALYSHSRMSSLVRKNEMEDMYSILEQTRENIDGQIEISRNPGGDLQQRYGSLYCI